MVWRRASEDRDAKATQLPLLRASGERKEKRGGKQKALPEQGFLGNASTG
jgi:hypothetical protein